jgi:predicted Zn-dependent protease
MAFLTRTLYQTYGVGTEYAGDRSLSSQAEGDDGRYDAVRLLEQVKGLRALEDDKILYLTKVELALQPGPLGEPPCYGFAQYGGEKAVLSLSKLPARGTSEESIELYRRRLAREAIHALGHLWNLHHDYDVRCAMHPSWSPALSNDPGMGLCTFCRDKSERKIRLAKT